MDFGAVKFLYCAPPEISVLYCIVLYCALPGPRRFNTENTTLEIRKVPHNMNNIAKMNEHFSQFGTIVNLQVRKRGMGDTGGKGRYVEVRQSYIGGGAQRSACHVRSGY